MCHACGCDRYVGKGKQVALNRAVEIVKELGLTAQNVDDYEDTELICDFSLKEFTGEAGMQRLVNEHDGVFRSVGALVDLASKDTWNETDAKTAEAYLDLVWEHPATCDGSRQTGRWIKRPTPTPWSIGKTPTSRLSGRQ